MNDELLSIPGVGKRIAADLHNLGINTVKDLRDKDPEDLYQKLMSKVGAHVDRCMLYVFRCAVYYSKHKRHDPERLK